MSNMSFTLRQIMKEKQYVSKYISNLIHILELPLLILLPPHILLNKKLYLLKRLQLHESLQAAILENKHLYTSCKKKSTCVSGNK